MSNNNRARVEFKTTPLTAARIIGADGEVKHEISPGDRLVFEPYFHRTQGLTSFLFAKSYSASDAQFDDCLIAISGSTGKLKKASVDTLESAEPEFSTKAESKPADTATPGEAQTPEAKPATRPLGGKSDG